MTNTPRTIIEKIWDRHVVAEEPGAPAVLYIDLHLIHEVTSPQAFDGLRSRGLKVRRTDRTVATLDHSIPTRGRGLEMADDLAAEQCRKLERNCKEFGVTLYGLDSSHRGIVHVIGPELGLTQPGLTIVCGDSHTATHGAFGALAFGIGTSEVEHVLATQCLLQRKPKTCEVRVEGTLQPGVLPKDVILALLAKIGVRGGTGHVFEYTGSAIRALTMEGRMTVCNMSIEGGARAGLIAPDETTFNYLMGRQFAPVGEAWDKAVADWKTLPSDPGAKFDKSTTLDAATLEPMITYGTNPGMGMPISGVVPTPEHLSDAGERSALEKAVQYMALHPGKPLAGQKIDVVFIGSCTNSRISDLREAAKVLKGRKVSPTVRTLVVPGSQEVKAEAEREGLHEVFKAAGAEWRESGCSMCIAMNGDQLAPGQYAVSTSNRNFEGRQGPGGRTFLASPITAAAAAVTGEITDPAEAFEVSTSRRVTMPKFTTLQSTVVPLVRNDIDTDQIIPARFLKITDKVGLGDKLFADWRYNGDGSPKLDFVINQPRYQGRQILLAGDNFGCGSSREHAPWALVGWGIRAVVALGFADIFKANSLKNGLLPVQPEPAFHAKMVELSITQPEVVASIDLAEQRISLPDGTSSSFPVDGFSKTCLLNDLDELGYLLRFQPQVEEYERKREAS